MGRLIPTDVAGGYGIDFGAAKLVCDALIDANGSDVVLNDAAATPLKVVPEWQMRAMAGRIPVPLTEPERERHLFYTHAARLGDIAQGHAFTFPGPTGGLTRLSITDVKPERHGNVNLFLILVCDAGAITTQ